MKAMHERSEQLKITLAKMRIAQRAKQKKEDEEDVTNMNTRSIFCAICKLNYSHGKSAHQASEAHKVCNEKLILFSLTNEIIDKPYFLENEKLPVAIL